MRELRPEASARGSVTFLAAMVVSIMALATATAPLTAAAVIPQSGETQEKQNPQRPALTTTAVAAEQAEATEPQQYPLIDVPAGAFPPPAFSAEDKLHSAIERLFDIYTRQGTAAALVFANRHGIQWRSGSVFVRIATGLPIPGLRPRDASSRAIVDGVLADLAVEGSRIRNVYGPHIEAWIPIEAIARLELNPSVRSIRTPWRMRSSATSEGRAVIGANQWDGVAFRGPDGGMQVGVIDLGFMGFRGLQGTDLPTVDRVFTRSFRDDDDFESDTEHGTAVAEIIYDIEQDIDLYLATVETIGDIGQAIDYFIQNDVDVINMSLGCVGCGPGDGTGTAIEIMERAPQAGIPFVTSAGNEADRHWMGPFVDSDGDGFLDFAPGDESNAFAGAAGDTVLIVMNWDFGNWFASSQDFDLLLLDAQQRIIDQSRLRQAGLPGQEATEEIAITLPFDGTFHVVVQRVEASANETLEIYIDLPGLQYQVPEQSLTVPADGRQIVAVGAARWTNDVPEPFSSRGPTKDGRMKPDMAGPDGVSTESFGMLGFFGTSAAAPHVVGAVSLLRARLGVVTIAEAFSILAPRLVDLPPTGPDNISGNGRVSLILR